MDVWYAFFAVAIGIPLVVRIVKGLRRWNRNNNSPLVTVPASVLSKREHVSGGSGNSSASTRYYVTFEIRGGERLELPVDGEDFGLLVERDRGQLSHQGTRYKGFARDPQDR